MDLQQVGRTTGHQSTSSSSVFIKTRQTPESPLAVHGAKAGAKIRRFLARLLLESARASPLAAAQCRACVCALVNGELSTNDFKQQYERILITHHHPITLPSFTNALLKASLPLLRRELLQLRHRVAGTLPPPTINANHPVPATPRKKRKMTAPRPNTTTTNTSVVPPPMAAMAALAAVASQQRNNSAFGWPTSVQSSLELFGGAFRPPPSPMIMHHQHQQTGSSDLASLRLLQQIQVDLNAAQQAIDRCRMALGELTRQHLVAVGRKERAEENESAAASTGAGSDVIAE